MEALLQGGTTPGDGCGVPRMPRCCGVTTPWQASNGQVFEVDGKEYRRHLGHRVRRADGVVSVSVPEEEKDAAEPAAAEGEAEVRESIRTAFRLGGAA